MSFQLCTLCRPIIVSAVNIDNISLIEISRNLFKYEESSCFGSGEVSLIVDINGSTDAITIEAYSIQADAVVGSVSGIAASGTVTFTFTLPTSADTTIVIRGKKETDTSTNPIIESGYIKAIY